MSDNQGISVMLHRLSSNSESVAAYRKALNQKIVALELDSARDKERLLLTFENGYRLALLDDGQSCCESRYMTTDDTLSDYVGADFVEVELRDAPSKGGEYEEHDIQFLVIKTSRGSFTIETHNQHNGYYGGFAIVAEEVTP